MPAENIEARVLKIASENFGVELSTVKLESTVTSLGGDSLDQLEFVMSIEDEFAIPTMPDDQAAKLTSVQATVDYLAAHSTAR